jgi:myosin V
MDKILQSNPILEAFGNARTIRNDNSSRFGKFIELNFNRRGHLIGGMIRTYLLEKVRLPTQQPGERNFHVFYQMMVGGSDEDIEDWNLENIEEYWYANQGGIFELQHVDDGDEYRAMRAALNTLSFPEDHQIGLFRVLAGLLHLGQVQFVADHDGEGCEVSPDESSKNHLENAARLLGLRVNDVAKTFTIRIINARGEIFEKKLTSFQAFDARDALSKAIYGQIFQWLVQNINKSIMVDMKNVRADIGVLDIFGFECFKQNSFEQLCINYTNETLQQQFNQFIFKMEQLEYQKEKIEWSFVEFPDNQDCLDLIEHKLNGVLAMIDDECKLPKASDEKLAARMYKAFESNKRFSASVTQKRDWLFCINHYAGPVVYSTLTFVDKNKDELPKESFSLLQTSSNSLVSVLFEAPVKPEKTNQTVPSVSSQFKEQLGSLMSKIYSTSPHYIRCLKPNDQNIPDCLDRVRVTEQLRYGGVLEAVRVARSGFPVRLIHIDFYTTYRPLVNPFSPAAKQLPRVIIPDKHNQRDYCQKLVTALFDSVCNILHPSMASWKKKKIDSFMEWSGALQIPVHNIQLGQSKVFLRKSAHDMLEAKRSKRLLNATIVIQSKIRSFIASQRYVVAKKAVEVLQRAFRVFRARKTVAKLRRVSACLLIQTSVRRFMHRFKFLWLRSAVLSIQRHYRRQVASKYAKQLRYSRNVNRLQSVAKLLIDIHRFRRYRKAIIKLQSGFRRSQARKTLKALRLQAKDIGKLQQSNESLKHEIEMLKAKALEDAKKLQLQIQQETEAKNNMMREKELSTLLEDIEALKLSLEREKALRKAAEAKVASVEEKVSSLEYLVETEYLPKLQKWREFPEIESQLSIARSKLFDVEEKLKVQNDIILRLETEKSYSLEDKYSMNPSPVRRESISRSRHGSMNVTDSDGDVGQVESLMSQLREERASKEVLEEEISRLRLISMDLNAQLESMKRNAARGRSSFIQPSSTPTNDNETTQPAEPASSRLRRSSISNTPSSTANRRPSMPATRTPMMAEIVDKEAKDDEIPDDIQKAFSPMKARRRQNSTIDQATLIAAVQQSNEPVGVMEKFEKNIEILQHKLKIGIVGQLWDGSKMSKVEALMKLDDLGRTLAFTPMNSYRYFAVCLVSDCGLIVFCYRGGFNFFSGRRLEIDPIR